MAYNYDKNIDYKSLLDKAASSGDMTTAATLEAQRNAKIAGEGLGYQQTNDYSKYLPDGGINAPTYTDTTKAQRDALTAQLLNPQKFTYNAEDDPLYQTYKEQYTASGNKAMQDTLAQVSARTGGLASSYAGQAAQQAYNGYMEQLSAKIPELYQLAYNQYLQEYSQNLDKLSLLRQQEQDEYAKYTDALSQYNTDRNWNYQQYLANAKTGTGSGKAAEDETAFTEKEQAFYDYYVNLLNNKSKSHAITYLNNAVRQGSISQDVADKIIASAGTTPAVKEAETVDDEAKYTKYTSVDSYLKLKKWANENDVSVYDALDSESFDSMKNDSIVKEGKFNRSSDLVSQYGNYENYVAIKNQFKAYEDYYDYLQDYLGYITSQN